MEYLDFCIAEDMRDIPPVTADSIYYVFADSFYRVSHLPIPDSFVFVATLSGQGTLQLKNRRLELNPGDIFLFDASKNSFSYYCSDINWNFWWFEFRCLTPDFLEITPEIPINIPLDDIQLYLCDEALNRLKLKDSKTASSLLASLLCLLQRRSREAPNVRRGVDLFRLADQYIRRNLDSATVETTARHLKVSEHTLLNIFQSLLGIRTVEYIHNMKTDMARHLLLTSENTVKGIADLLGYADQFVFSKSFRKRFGMSPIQYKEMKRNYNEHQSDPLKTQDSDF